MSGHDIYLNWLFHVLDVVKVVCWGFSLMSLMTLGIVVWAEKADSEHKNRPYKWKWTLIVLLAFAVFLITAILLPDEETAEMLKIYLSR